MKSENTRFFLRLSYDIDEDTPHFSSVSPLRRSRQTRVENGDASNTSSVEIHSHYGTHVDVPYHFHRQGLKITDLDVNRYHFTNPLLLEIPKEKDQPIRKEDLAYFESVISDKDLLLIKTGFSKYRKDHDRYLSNPYLDINSAHYLTDDFPELRALGIDCVSILNRNFRAIGIEAHRILLGCYDQERYLLLFEDLNLSCIGREVEEVFALPLFVRDADAFPCTVIAR
jgi:arylformamidase